MFASTSTDFFLESIFLLPSALWVVMDAGLVSVTDPDVASSFFAFAEQIRISPSM